MALSVIALLVVAVFPSHWHFAGGGSVGNAYWTDFTVDLGVSGYYLIPIILCGVMGLLYLLWPSRKPPKLPK